MKPEDNRHKSPPLLSEELCAEAGVIPLNLKGNILKIGAMNPGYRKVNQIVEDLKKNKNISVTIKQISPLEWEKWFLESNSNELNFDLNLETNELDLPDNQITKKSSSPMAGKLNNDEDINNGLIDKYDTNEEEDLEPTRIEIDENDPLYKLANSLDQFQEQDEDEFVKDDEIQLENDLSDSEDPIISGVARLLTKCVQLRASDIHVEPLEERFRIRYRLDGVLEELISLPISNIGPFVSRLKIMSNLDISEKRLPQDGRLRCILEGRQCDFRVSTLPGRWGEKVVLRSLEQDTLLNLDILINSDKELKSIREMGDSPYGILIVVGPTGSGKSTTLYSILNELNKPGVNISTVEDPVEYTLDGIHQVQVLREKGLDFSRALRSLMRQDPDIILVGETRDKETAQTAMEAALTGHMVFTTLHANDTATAITRLSEMGIPPYLVGASVIGVVAQRLVRKVCPRCSRTRKLQLGKDDLALSHAITQVKEANITSTKKSLNKQNKKICTLCGGAGYKGRAGIYEVMRINDSLRELIMNNATADVIRENAFKKSGRSLLAYGMELVKRQLTTIEEVERVCLLEENS